MKTIIRRLRRLEDRFCPRVEGCGIYRDPARQQSHRQPCGIAETSLRFPTACISPDQPGSLVRAAPILTTAATLHTHGVTRIDTARQAAEALRPLAGKAAYWLFTLGLIGTGMLGVPVLAGSSVYAIPEASVWRGSLEKKPRGARRFYVVLTGPWSAGSRLISWGWTPSR
jgi:hypothetical protein